MPATVEWTSGQFNQAIQFVQSTDRVMEFTADVSDVAQNEVAMIIVKLSRVYGPKDKADLDRAAEAEAFSDALCDVPVFAIREAMRRWHRGECGNDENGRPYLYPLGPKPPQLRRIAIYIASAARYHARVIRQLVEARYDGKKDL